MGDLSSSSSKVIRVKVEPGICGLPCVIELRRSAKYSVLLKAADSDCKHVRRLFQNLHEMNLRDLFAPFSRNPVFLCAQQAGCHPSCPIPAAALKGVEIAMEMALPRNVSIRFTVRKGKRTR
ncbi:MAG: DUF6951 family protein [Deltaproteobacteria bacterium]